MLPHNSYASPGPLRSRAWIPSSLSTDKMKDGCRSRGICLAMAVGLWVAKLGGSLTKCDHIIYVHIYIILCAYIYMHMCMCIYLCMHQYYIYMSYVHYIIVYVWLFMCQPKNLDCKKGARYSFPVTMIGLHQIPPKNTPGGWTGKTKANQPTRIHWLV